MKIKMKFVQLKAEGIPTYMIARELGVHRTTLTMWNKELAEYILIAKQDFIDELLYENNMTKIVRIETISNHLRELYDKLNGFNDNDNYYMTYEHNLNAILKLTKLLHLEQDEKHVERLFKDGQKKNINVNSMKDSNESENGNIIDEEAPLWITNMKQFRKHQPEKENKPAKGYVKKTANENLQNARVVKDNEQKEDCLNFVTLRDISDEDPQIQEIFSKTFLRRPKVKKEIKEENKNEAETESVKNSSQQENEEKEE